MQYDKGFSALIITFLKYKKTNYKVLRLYIALSYPLYGMI